MKNPIRLALGAVCAVALTAVFALAKPDNKYKPDATPPQIVQPATKWLGHLVYVESYSEHGHAIRNLMSHDGVEVGLRADGVVVWRPVVTRVVRPQAAER